jgi:TolA-binding protein
MEDFFARIEDYLDGKLTRAERAAFENEANSNPALAQALAQVREMRERLVRQWAQENSENKLRSTLKGLGKKHFRSQDTTRRTARHRPAKIWWIVAAAATALLLLWLAWPPASERLYTTYRQFPTASFTTKNTDEQTLVQMSKSFNNKDFQSALAGLTAYLQKHPEDLEAHFFVGLCQLELGHFSEAESIFTQIISAENAWSGEAHWYLALTYLRWKKTEECKKTLLQILPGEAHYEEATELLKKLK